MADCSDDELFTCTCERCLDSFETDSPFGALYCDTCEKELRQLTFKESYRCNQCQCQCEPTVVYTCLGCSAELESIDVESCVCPKCGRNGWALMDVPEKD